MSNAQHKREIMDDIESGKMKCYIIDGFVHRQKWYIKKEFHRDSSVENQPTNLQSNSQHEVLGK